MTRRIAIVVSHPVQHFCPMYRHLAESDRVDIRVFFASGPQAHDAAFGQSVDLGTEAELEHIPHTVLGEGDVGEADGALSRRDLWAGLDEYTPDVVVIYGFFRRISRQAWSWALVHRCPRIYISDSEDRGEKGSKAIRALRRPIEAVILSTMTWFFAVGIANEEFYRRRLVRQGRIVRVPFSIDRRLYDAADTTPEARALARSALEASDMTILMTCGKFIARKRQRDIIRAVAATGRDDLLVLLVGSGPESEALRSLAEELGVNVHFAGFLPPRDLPALYLAADVYVHPSTFDPHPLAVSEAIYAGLPAIVSDRTGSWGDDDDVRDGVNGFVHRAGDVEHLADCILRLVHDIGLRRRFGAESLRIGRDQQVLANEGFLDALLRVMPARDSAG